MKMEAFKLQLGEKRRKGIYKSLIPKTDAIWEGQKLQELKRKVITVESLSNH